MPRSTNVRAAAAIHMPVLLGERSVFVECASWLARRLSLDAVGWGLAAVATTSVVINALFLQSRPHPAPMLAFGQRPVVTEAAPPPRAPASRPASSNVAKSEPAPSVRTRVETLADIQRELSRRGFYDGPSDGIYGARTDAAVRDFAQAAGLKTGLDPDEALLRTIARSSIRAVPAAAPVAPAANAKRQDPIASFLTSSKRVVAMQRALADFGYGQVAPTGTVDGETKAAIERFERERKLPVSGQVTERLTRELAAVTGRPLE